MTVKDDHHAGLRGWLLMKIKALREREKEIY